LCCGERKKVTEVSAPIEKILEIVSVPPRIDILRLLVGEESLTHTEISLQLSKPYGCWEALKKMVEYDILLRQPISPKEVRYAMNKATIKQLGELFTSLL
jgi:DNA-binding transcriptional ArsR family regulator